MEDEIDDILSSKPLTVVDELGFRALNLEGNWKTQKVQFMCRHDVDFTKKNSIGPSLGFGKTVHKALERHVSTKAITILDYPSINVEFSLVNGAYNNGVRRHILHELFMQSRAGYKLVDYARPLIYYPITVRVVDKIQIKFTNQEGKLLELTDQTSRERLHLRPCQ